MEDASRILGIVVVDHASKIVSSIGKGADSRIMAMATDPVWVKEAAQKRIVPILFREESFAAIYTEASWGRVILILAEPPETVLNFMLSVDFAWDIIDHILTDPFDAMVVVGTNERLAFLSPVHEKFFGLKAGAAIDKKVREVIPNSRLQHVLRTGVAEVGQVLNVGGRQRIVSRHPVQRDGKIVGAIGRVMFKGPQQLEEMSLRIKELEKKVAQYELESKEDKFGEQFLDAIIGQSIAIQSVRQQIRKIAPLDVPVLIQGESGTGKELVARALHMLSARRDARLVTVNAAALPANLVESELFGYEAGSFTGADRKGRVGKFELADKGTIFLDEIGDMPIEVQSKLLRVLQDRVVERIGGERSKRVDFRLCSATNHNLEQLVEENRFRLDLFYRISPVCITIPPLSERAEDIPLLLRHFLNEFAEKYGTPIPDIASSVPNFLMERRWPGNIRQLRHEIERAMVFSEGGVLKETDFSQDGIPRPGAERYHETPASRVNVRPVQKSESLKESIDRVEKNIIADALVRYKGNKKKVAENLGISRSYLYKKISEDTEFIFN